MSRRVAEMSADGSTIEIAGSTGTLRRWKIYDGLAAVEDVELRST